MSERKIMHIIGFCFGCINSMFVISNGLNNNYKWAFWFNVIAILVWLFYFCFEKE
jgi:hypothetical protein